MAAPQTSFRELCERHGITVTHQRQVLYDVMQSMDGHPSPEEIFASVRQQIPAISLATVYKNIQMFVSSGLLREVSLHHGPRRVEWNSGDHHHLVCSECKSILDLDAASLGVNHLKLGKGGKLPGGFRAERVSIDVIGVCAACQAQGGGR